MSLDHQVPSSYHKLNLSIQSCQKCSLSKLATPLPGIGPFDKKILIIGEAPGEKEDKLKEPFVGRSGNLLNQMLKSINVKREDCFITNVVKCRPMINNLEKTYNRTPTSKEINKCSPYLQSQINLIKPNIIISLGKIPLDFMNTYYPINISSPSIKKVQGKIINVATNVKGQDYIFIYLPLYHPAYILRNRDFLIKYKDSFSRLIPFIKNMSLIITMNQKEIDKWI